MESSIWSVVWSWSAEWWKWVIVVAVALWVWETIAEHWFYRAKAWVMKVHPKSTKKWTK